MDRIVLPLAGREVDNCFVSDWCFGLAFSTRHELCVRIDTKFVIDRRGSRLEFERGELDGLGKAIYLAGKTILESVALEDGTLKLTFSEGSVLLVPPDERYEAWTVGDMRGHMAVCTPGGKVAVFDY